MRFGGIMRVLDVCAVKRNAMSTRWGVIYKSCVININIYLMAKHLKINELFFWGTLVLCILYIWWCWIRKKRLQANVFKEVVNQCFLSVFDSPACYLYSVYTYVLFKLLIYIHFISFMYFTLQMANLLLVKVENLSIL